MREGCFANSYPPFDRQRRHTLTGGSGHDTFAFSLAHFHGSPQLSKQRPLTHAETKAPHPSNLHFKGPRTRELYTIRGCCAAPSQVLKFK
jgi:hypothetical protein